MPKREPIEFHPDDARMARAIEDGVIVGDVEALDLDAYTDALEEDAAREHSPTLKRRP